MTSKVVRLLGRGVQGCIFHPPAGVVSVRCWKGSPASTDIKQWTTGKITGNDTYVLKVMPRHEAVREQRIAQQLADNDPKRDKGCLFLEPPVECVLDPEQFREAWTDRRRKKKSAEAKPPCYGYLVPHGGISYSRRLHRLRKRPWLRLLDDCIQLLEILQFMHQTAGVVHRDIKAANLAYKNGRVRVLDFGISVSLKSNLKALLQSMDNVRFQIWSIELNVKHTGMRRAEAFAQWLRQPEVRAWALWLDYFRLGKGADLGDWHTAYVTKSARFWEHAEQYAQVQDEPQFQEACVKLRDAVVMMLRQNDVLGLGLMLCHFVFRTYIPYQQKHKKSVEQPLVFAKWIHSVLLPMIYPSFHERITVDVALQQCLKIREELKKTGATSRSVSRDSSRSSLGPSSTVSTASLNRRENERPIESPDRKRARIVSG